MCVAADNVLFINVYLPSKNSIQNIDKFDQAIDSLEFVLEFEKLAFAYNSIFYKLFGVKSKKEIAFAQLHCGFLDFSNLQNFHRLSFLSKLGKAGFINKGTRLDETDWCDYERLSNSYNINLSPCGSNIKFYVYRYTESYLASIC